MIQNPKHYNCTGAHFVIITLYFNQSRKLRRLKERNNTNIAEWVLAQWSSSSSSPATATTITTNNNNHINNVGLLSIGTEHSIVSVLQFATDHDLEQTKSGSQPEKFQDLDLF
jgi:hypothetical protein